MKRVCVVLFPAIWTVCAGDFYSPIAFTLRGVSQLNGSNANGGCPSICLNIINSINTCNCEGKTGDLSGVSLFNDVIPEINLNEGGTWASELYTAWTSQGLYDIGLLFHSNMAFTLRLVDLYLFFCPSWNIPIEGLTISICRSLVFPNYIPSSDTPFGSVTLTRDMQNCNSLTRASIITEVDATYTNYFFVFSNAPPVGGIYIGEVKFSDEPPSTTSLSITIPNTTQASEAMNNIDMSKTIPMIANHY